LGNKGSKPEPCRLYLVTPPVFDPAVFRDDVAAALDAGDVAAFQLWLNDPSDDQLKRAIDTLRPVVQARDVAFLVNGRPDLAVAMGCDGAHLDQTGADIAAARKKLGDLTLGVSCLGSRELAFDAGEDGADYVSFGGFFPSGTKNLSEFVAPDIIAWWAEMMELPCVAVGGLNAENCAPLVKAGADFVAVVGAVWSHPDGPAAGVRAMNAAINAAK
jgi:thiamine-phosphate pyrophosphorylase